ncbi:MAG: DegV family protein [Oscillospiraceae bacterium]|nr:DegV family protein [Oscillospiraceae bacterium]
MNKIKILTDSSCDIPKDKEKELDIKIMNFPIIVDGKDYHERVDFDSNEYFKMMDESAEFPSTSQITMFEFLEAYKELFKQGFTDVIHITISSTGSNTHNAALMARNEFYDEVEDADRMRIHIVDSANYTAVQGYGVIQAGIKAQKGSSVDEILSYLEDWYSSAEVIFAAYTLKYAKRSGRISATAAFAGEMLGLKPIIKIAGGVSSTPSKVRGDKNIIPKIVEMAEDEMIPHTPYCIVYGSIKEYADELSKAMTKKFGYPPEWICQIGAAVASNAGHQVAGVVIKSNRRK